MRNTTRCTTRRRPVEAAAKLSHRYLTGRFLPDKAIDILDEAGARKRVSQMTRPDNISQMETRIEELKERKTQAVGAQLFEEAAHIRDEEKQAGRELQNMLDAWRTSYETNYVPVTEEDVMAVLAKWTGIPLARMEEKETTKLLRMEEELKSKVIGQDEAASAIARALRRSRADIKDPRRPIGSFLFLGPTGVGKTYLARNLAEIMFGTADALIQVDMSEYMEKHTTSRLIGSPPGYVGHDEGGQLTEAVRRRPYSVILFDEVEKAHPDVMNLLLQILEEGSVTDSLGRKINFRNTIIILTSNVGAASAKRQSTMGFGAMASDKADYAAMREKILEEARKQFRPEFLNRFDEISVFRMLERDDLEHIVQLEADKLISRLKAKDIALSLSPEALSLIIKNGYDPQYGARPMRPRDRTPAGRPAGGSAAAWRREGRRQDRSRADGRGGNAQLPAHCRQTRRKGENAAQEGAAQTQTQAQGGIILPYGTGRPPAFTHAGGFAFSGNQEQTLKILKRKGFILP